MKEADYITIKTSEYKELVEKVNAKRETEVTSVTIVGCVVSREFKDGSFFCKGVANTGRMYEWYSRDYAQPGTKYEI